MQNSHTLSPSRSASVTGDFPPLTQPASIINEGYENLYDPGPAPDDAKTAPPQRRGTALSQEQDARIRHSSQRMQNIELRIYERSVDGGWRTQLPRDAANADRTSRVHPGSTQSDSQRNSTARKEWKISHTWENKIAQQHDDTQPSQGLQTFDTGPPNSSSPCRRDEFERYISWVHRYKHVATQSAFEELVLGHPRIASTAGIKGLAKRLFKRVFTSAEQDFIRGKFLLPTAIRYDGYFKSPGQQEKPCLFFNFPYLSIDHHHTKSCKDCVSSKAEDHPVRALFQFRYRLQSTDTKDSSQVVAKLKSREMRKCIPEHLRKGFHDSSKVESPLVHVPQIWFALFNSELLCTSGPLEERSLRSKVVNISERSSSADQRPAPSLVRIVFEHSGTVEYFTYPTEQCSWWFALLSKQRLILSYLNNGHGESRKDQRKTATHGKRKSNRVSLGPDLMPSMKEYIFCRDKDMPHPDNHITIHNWRTILSQRARGGECLDIWLRQRAPSVSVSSASSTTGIASSSQHPTLTSTATAQSLGLMPTPGMSGPSLVGSVSDSRDKSSSKSDNTENKQPFLCWPIVDDFRNPDTNEPLDRAMSILWLVYEDFCNTTAAPLIDQGGRKVVRQPTVGTSTTTPNDNEFLLQYTHAKLVKQLTANRALCASDDYYSTLHELLDRSRRLIQFYFSFPDQDPSDPSRIVADPSAVTLYWSLIRAILLEGVSKPGAAEIVTATTMHLKNIERLASELQLGTEVASGFADPVTNSSLLNRVLLDTVVKGLSRSFELLSLAHEQLLQGTFRGDDLSKAAKNVTDALSKAKNQLIVEADDLLNEKERGSVVTPEAIAILLLERLSAGVYSDDSIDVLEVYEQTIEAMVCAPRMEMFHFQLLMVITQALKLDSEKGASRRLLVKINGIREELDVIEEVLRQQKSLLGMFRHALDPDSFQQKSIVREIRFETESDCLDNIVSSVDARLVDCTELKDRTLRLAEQNVQLIETQQDDNGKAIMVFTIVTVLFLPPSFVSSYFGMNFAGISDTTSTPGHFWYIAAPLTVGVTLLCVFVVYLTTIKRRWKRWRDGKKEGIDGARHIR